MSKTAGKKKRAQPRLPEPKSPPNPAARSSELVKINENSETNNKSGLSFRQEAALHHVAFSPTLPEAVRATGISERTLRRWMDDPVFAQAVEAIREEASSKLSEEMEGLLLRAAAVFAECLADPNPAIRLRAATRIVQFTHQNSEARKISASLDRLEDALEYRIVRQPLPRA